SGAARSAPSAPSPASLRSRRALPSFTAEAERLGNPQVEGKLRGASKRVDRNKRLAGCGLGIESAKWSAVNAPVNACCRTSVRRDEARPLVEQCGTNQVLAQGNVVGPSGTEHHEGAEAERPRHADCPADKGSVSDIKGGPAIVCEYVVRVGRESVDSSRIAVSVVQRVVAVEQQLGAGAHGGVYDQLVLPEDPRRSELVDGLFDPIGVHTAVRRAGRS